MDMIIKLTGEALPELTAELNEGCHTLRIAVDDGEVKLKADEDMWTTGLNGAVIEAQRPVVRFNDGEGLLAVLGRMAGYCFRLDRRGAEPVELYITGTRGRTVYGRQWDEVRQAWDGPPVAVDLADITGVTYL